MYTVYKFGPKKSQQKDCPTLKEAKAQACKYLGATSLKELNKWTGDSLSGYSRGFSRLDDPFEAVFVEIRCEKWEAQAQKDRDAAKVNY